MVSRHISVKHGDMDAITPPWNVCVLLLGFRDT